jgi:hypothetical protein
MSRIAHGFQPAANICNPKRARFIKPWVASPTISCAIRSGQDDPLPQAVENQPFPHAKGAPNYVCRSARLQPSSQRLKLQRNRSVDCAACAPRSAYRVLGKCVGSARHLAPGWSWRSAEIRDNTIASCDRAGGARCFGF